MKLNRNEKIAASIVSAVVAFVVFGMIYLSVA